MLCPGYWPRAARAPDVLFPLADEPPRLFPIPSSNEDQRRGYRDLNQPQVHYTCVLMNLCSCAEPRRAYGIVLPGLICIPVGMQTVETTWVTSLTGDASTQGGKHHPHSLIVRYIASELERWICTGDRGATRQTCSFGSKR